MANSQGGGTRRVRRRASRGEWVEGSPRKSRGGKGTVTIEPDDAGRRRVKIEKLASSTSIDRTAATSRMNAESRTTLSSYKSPSSRRNRREHHRSPELRNHRRRRRSRSSSRDRSPTGPSKAPQSNRRTPDTATLGLDDESSEDESMEQTPPAECIEDRPRKRKVKVVYVTEGGYGSPKHRDRGGRGERRSADVSRAEDTPRSSRTRHSRRQSVAEDPSSPSPRRVTLIREPASTSPSNLRRSNTINVPSTRHYISPAAPANASTARRSSFMGSFFGSTAPQHHEPERLIKCLTCLSDDIPRSKSAKLKCGHRMCHSCLKRIFKLSITDPQHMPPKCCTSDHIPLKHVDRLFNVNFKKTWNKKFQEYSTKNRIYCPAKRCGEWIKPQNIHKEDGKKYGKCSRCKTKVCCLCNGKWHGAKDCPKDEETNRLLETAKQAGWQRCYNCRTMVELKEGCNHMTCHCTAEFCMICGVKWKSCDCPWFNYEAVEEDLLRHMQIPQPVENREAPAQRPRERLRRPRPNTYHEEMNQRHRQERVDEDLARRLQAVSINDDDDYQGGIGDIHGVGNGAGHFMNQDYIRTAHNIIAGTFDQATAAANYVMGGRQTRATPPQPPPAPRQMAERYPMPPPVVRPPSPPPILRRQTTAGHAYNTSPSTRPSERVVPRRTRTDYESEAAVHAPLPRTPEHSSPSRAPRPSVLAGLGGARKGSNRVNAWRTHVEPGVTPEEGVLSIV